MVAAMLVGQLFAAGPIEKEFIGTSGPSHRVHFANEAEIRGLDGLGAPSSGAKDTHANRLGQNQVRLMKVGDDWMFGGRMVYGVQPFPGEFPKPSDFLVGAKISETGAFAIRQQELMAQAKSTCLDTARVSTILSFFHGFASLCSIPDLSYTEGTRVSGMKVTWVSPVHAATVITKPELPEYNTFSFYEGVASLVKQLDLNVATEEVIPTVNKPSFLLVHSSEKPTGVESRKSVAIQLPIWQKKVDNDGWIWAIFARIDGQDIPGLPAELTSPIAAYRAWSDSLA